MYLQYLADPSSIVDVDSVKILEETVELSTDPVDKLKAIAALERARSKDGSEYEAAFVRDAKAWADSEGIPGSAFRSMGVPAAVLTRAGFGGGRARRSGAAAGPRTGRAKSTNIAAIQNWVLASNGSFTLADVQRGVGGSAATVKKAIDALAEAGQVENLGALSTHAARGRAPFHYRRIE